MTVSKTVDVGSTPTVPAIKSILSLWEQEWVQVALIVGTGRAIMVKDKQIALLLFSKQSERCAESTYVMRYCLHPRYKDNKQV